MNTQQATTDTQHAPHSYGPFNGGSCGGFGKKFGDKFSGRAPWKQAFAARWGNRKAANIQETDTEFVISLYAAGLDKSGFSVSVTDDVLTISYTAAETTSTAYSHQEYQPASFERSFQLNGKVLTDSIAATYTDGVLKVTMPKNPETNKPAQQVTVL